MAMKRPLSRPPSETEPLTLEASGLLARYPVLWQFLTDDLWDDGTRRCLPTLLLFVGENGLTAALNDRDNERTVFKSGGTLEGLLDGLELGLRSDVLEWRPSAPRGKQKKRG